jgi:hypothetical protein
MVGVKLRSPLSGDEEDGKKHKEDKQQIQKMRRSKREEGEASRPRNITF